MSEQQTSTAGGTASFGQDGAAVGGSVPKVATGIAGFDEMAMGGLPRRRVTAVTGQAGSAKTVFAAQFLAEGVRLGQPGVFVSLEEPVAELRANLRTLGHDLDTWEADGRWAFVDASPQVRLQTGEPGGVTSGAPVAPYYLQTLLAQIAHAVDATAADRIVLDSLTAVLSLNPDPAVARQMMRALVTSLKAMRLTIVVTVETPTDPSDALGTVGVEEFVADNVVLVHNIREGRARRRTLEILKMRGAAHFKTESAFVVLPGRGLVILPTSRSPRDEPGSDEVVSSGDEVLDTMLGGGLREGTVTLVSGPTGAGKTLLASTFAAAGPRAGSTTLFLAYEESRAQVLRNGAGWGHDLRGAQERGLLHVAAFYPDAAGLDEHLLEIQDLITRLRPARLVVDSLSALARLGTGESNREFATRLVAFCKQEQVTTLITLAADGDQGGLGLDQAHTTALADAIVLVHQELTDTARRRRLTVLKVRGGTHDDRPRSFTVSSRGLEMQVRGRD